jgi:phenylacetate-CoA ligase
MECENGRLHQNVGFCRVDLSPLGDSAESGIGRIFATTFGNKWSPLVRFDVGDIVRMAPGPCPCGRNFGMTLSAIEGRMKSLCVAADGRLVTHREVDDALASIDGWNSTRSSRRMLGSPLAVVGEDGQGKRAAQDAVDILRGIFGKAVDIKARQVQTLLPEKSGKFLLSERNFPLDPSSIRSK